MRVLTAFASPFGAAHRDSALVAPARRDAATVGHFSTMIAYASIAFLTLGGLGVVVLQECALTVCPVSLCKFVSLDKNQFATDSVEFFCAHA